MSKYAADTSVSVERSRSEIESTLQRYGADGFAYGWDRQRAVVQFQADGRHIRFILELPDRNDKEFTHTPSRGTKRTDTQSLAAWEQACRQRWRALNLVIKAKLEAVEAGISTFDEEFLSHIMLPNGTTVGESVMPEVNRAYESGQMPTSLLALPTGGR